MKVSIITPSYNSAKTIEDTLRSVADQTYSNIEHIVIDGGSKDGTMNIVKEYGDSVSKFVSEPDEGIFDAMNKGIKMAAGDIVGILNSDDFYADDDIIEKVVGEMEKEKVDCIWGDLVYVHPNNTGKVVRKWKSLPYKKGKFQKGWMPPHPTFFVKKWVYDKYGLFDRRFERVSADYEIMLRFLERYGVKSAYIPEVLVKMRAGGNSTRNLKQIIIGNWECYKSWGVNGLKVSPSFIFLKLGRKISQFINK